MSTYMVFLGEHGEHDMTADALRKESLAFAQAACIFEPEHYKGEVVPLVRDLEGQYGEGGKPPRSPEGRKRYYEELAKVITESKFSIVAGSIDRTRQREQLDGHGYGPGNPYELTFKFIMERLVLLLAPTDHACRVIARSRGEKPDGQLRAVYDQLMKDGTEHLHATGFQKLIGGIELASPDAGETGLQFADLVATGITGKTLGDKKNDVISWDIFAEKFCRSHVGRIPGYGFMMFPS